MYINSRYGGILGENFRVIRFFINGFGSHEIQIIDEIVDRPERNNKITGAEREKSSNLFLWFLKSDFVSERSMPTIHTINIIYGVLTPNTILVSHDY